MLLSQRKRIAFFPCFCPRSESVLYFIRFRCWGSSDCGGWGLESEQAKAFQECAGRRERDLDIGSSVFLDMYDFMKVREKGLRKLPIRSRTDWQIDMHARRRCVLHQL